jgi:acyl carrier protein
MDELETQIKHLIVEALLLDGVDPDGIDSAAPLFGVDAGKKGLGLDSIDALELAIAIDKKFGIKVRADDEQNRSIFASVQSLAAYVAQNRKA